MSTEAKPNAFIESLRDKVNGVLEKYPAVDEPITKITGLLGGKVDKAYVAVALAVIPIVIVLVGGVGHLLIDMIGFIYPMYMSIKAIESEEKADDSQWLTYWLIFTLFKIVEGVADFILSTIPFYFIIKGGFLVWCYYPTTQGAKVIYNNVVKTILVPHLGVAAKDETKKD